MDASSGPFYIGVSILATPLAVLVMDRICHRNYIHRDDDILHDAPSPRGRQGPHASRATLPSTADHVVEASAAVRANSGMGTNEHSEISMGERSEATSLARDASLRELSSAADRQPHSPAPRSKSGGSQPLIAAMPPQQRLPRAGHQPAPRTPSSEKRGALISDSV